MQPLFHYHQKIRKNQHKPSSIARNGKYKNMIPLNRLKKKIKTVIFYGALPKKRRIYYNDRKLASTYFYRYKSYVPNNYINKKTYSEDHLPYTDLFYKNFKSYGSTLRLVQQFRGNPDLSDYSFHDYYSKNLDFGPLHFTKCYPPPTQEKNKLGFNCFYKCYSLNDILAKVIISDFLTN